MRYARFSWNIDDMIQRALPETGARIVGYAYLINHLGLDSPAPIILSAIGKKHTKYETDGWRIFTPRHTPEDSLYGHLAFALRYEGIDLSVLNALFRKTPPAEIEQIVQGKPTGRYTRRIWFLYEFLTGETLNVLDLTKREYVDLVDSKTQYPGPLRPSKRHRINNNLPGVRNFCPLIRRTEKLDALIKRDLSKEVLENISTIDPDVLMRASSFLLLKDSKASYAIEGETPPNNRAENWGQIIGQAGKRALSKAEFERLQKEVIVNSRFVHMGYRYEGGFIGSRDRSTLMPIPSHISAKHQDLDTLMEGLIQTIELLRNSDFPPVLAATLIAFGFVFIHPLEDGNGRLHRYLLHHVLIDMGFTPDGLVFPISSVILKRIKDYVTVLEAYSKPRLAFIEWRPTVKGNVEVVNETIDLYRYFDVTPQSEFVYECVHETITKLLPSEIRYLQQYDEMKTFVNAYVDMPDRTADLLVLFLYQNDGILSKRARNKEFQNLSDEEVQVFENKFKEVFEGP
ncbi:MAG: Fic family protein [Gammaproteobacteria bacterium]|nr:Fic family protein [Gammaproteobacteria bacterium]